MVSTRENLGISIPNSERGRGTRQQKLRRQGGRQTPEEGGTESQSSQEKSRLKIVEKMESYEEVKKHKNNLTSEGLFIGVKIKERATKLLKLTMITVEIGKEQLRTI